MCKNVTDYISSSNTCVQNLWREKDTHLSNWNVVCSWDISYGRLCFQFKVVSPGNKLELNHILLMACSKSIDFLKYPFLGLFVINLIDLKNMWSFSANEIFILLVQLWLPQYISWYQPSTWNEGDILFTDFSSFNIPIVLEEVADTFRCVKLLCKLCGKHFQTL